MKGYRSLIIIVVHPVSIGFLCWHFAFSQEPSPFEKLQAEVNGIVESLYADIRANYKFQEGTIPSEDMPKWLILYFNERIGPNKQHLTDLVATQPLLKLKDAFLTDFFYFFLKLSTTEITKGNLIYLNQKYFHPRELALTLFKVLVSQDQEFFERFSKILQDDLEIQKREMQKAYEVGEIIGRLYPKASKSQKWEHEIGFAKEYHESKLKDMQERFVKMMELYRLMWSKDQFQELVMEAGCYYLSYFWSFRKNVLPQEDIALSADPKYKADLLRQVDLDPDISRKEHQETVIARWPDSQERRAMLTLFQTLCVEGVTDSIAHLKKELLRFEDQVAEIDPTFLPSGGTSEDFHEFEEDAAQIEKLPRSWEKPRTLHFMGRDNAGDLIALYAYAEDFFLLLVETSSDPNQSEEYRSHAVETLRKMGKKAIPALITVLGKDSSGSVRSCAARTLGKMGGEAASAIPALIKALGDSEEYVRNCAANALGKMGGKAIPALIRALKNSKGIVRASAAIALGSMEEEAAPVIPALVRVLGGDNDGEVRSCAARALGEIGKKAEIAIPALIKALGDRNAAVRASASLALGKMEEKAAPAILTLIEVLGEDDNEAVRRFAAEALGEIGEKAEPAIPALIKAIGDTSWGVSSSAAEALGKMGEKAEPAVPALIKALGEDGNWVVRSCAAWALGEIREKAEVAIPALIMALKDSDETVRTYAADALEKMGKKGQQALRDWQERNK